jgi:hypothetical protein
MRCEFMYTGCAVLITIERRQRNLEICSPTEAVAVCEEHEGRADRSSLTHQLPRPSVYFFA